MLFAATISQLAACFGLILLDILSRFPSKTTIPHTQEHFFFRGLLQFETQEDAGDERGKDFVGLHHFGIRVDDIETTKRAIETHGGSFHAGPTAHVPANAEHKIRDPNGIVFDISTHGWDGAKKLEEG